MSNVHYPAKFTLLDFSISSTIRLPSRKLNYITGCKPDAVRYLTASSRWLGGIKVDHNLFIMSKRVNNFPWHLTTVLNTY